MIQKITSHLNKFVWLWITTQGKTTPAEIMQETGIKHRSTMKALAELRAGGFVVRLSAGLYCAAECTDCAVSRTDHAAGRTKSAAGDTCAAGCTAESAAECTECAARCTSECTKKDIKQNKTKQKKGDLEKKGIEKNTDILFEHVDRTSERYLTVYQAALKVFHERGVSPDLVERIAAAVVLRLPGADDVGLKQIKSEAVEAVCEGRLKSRWIHVANQVRKIYEAAGWTWTKCRTEKERMLQELNRVRAEKEMVEQLAADRPAQPSGKVRRVSHPARGVESPAADSLAKLGRRLREKTG